MKISNGWSLFVQFGGINTTLMFRLSRNHSKGAVQCTLMLSKISKASWSLIIFNSLLFSYIYISLLQPTFQTNQKLVIINSQGKLVESYHEFIIVNEGSIWMVKVLEARKIFARVCGCMGAWPLQKF